MMQFWVVSDLRAAVEPTDCIGAGEPSSRFVGKKPGRLEGVFGCSVLPQLPLVAHGQPDNHCKLPDVLIYTLEKNWLLSIESATSHGPVDPKRQIELTRPFKHCTARLVCVSAFPDRKTFHGFCGDIAWKSEVWIADAPMRMIHFNGGRFLGPC